MLAVGCPDLENSNIDAKISQEKSLDDVLQIITKTGEDNYQVSCSLHSIYGHNSSVTDVAWAP